MVKNNIYMVTFYDTVAKACKERPDLAKKLDLADALKVLAADAVILNISDGHNYATISLNETDSVMIALREHTVESWNEEVACG